MKAYQVQFILPVDKPEDNVRRTLKKTVVVFDVPINLPNLHTIGYSDLVALAELRESLDLSTPLNNTVDSKSKKSKQ